MICSATDNNGRYTLKVAAHIIIFTTLTKDHFMDSVRYDIYFTGKLVEGYTSLQAQQQFAQLFKMTPEKAAQLFTGQPQLIKRNIDKAQALKYKQALHKAGMLTAFKAHKEQTQQQASQAAAAEKPDSASAQTAPAKATPQVPPKATTSVTTGLTLADTGSDILNENERQQPVQRDVDTSAIKLVSPFLEPEPAQQQPVASAPDTKHLSIAESGADLLEGHHTEWVELELDLSAIAIAPPGELLGQLEQQKAPLNPDTSQMSLAEPGADLLEGQPQKITPPAPDTSHLSIKDEK